VGLSVLGHRLVLGLAVSGKARKRDGGMRTRPKTVDEKDGNWVPLGCCRGRGGD